MIRFLSLNFLVLSAFSLVSCGTSRALTSDIKSSQIDKMLIFNPIVKIDSISQGNKHVFNKTESDNVNANVKETIKLLLPKHITLKDAAADTLQQQIIEREMFKILTLVERNQSIKNVRIGDTLLQIINTYDCNYAMGVFDGGFYRTKSNFAGQIGKGIGIGILTFGMFTPVPYKSANSIFCFVIDKNNKNIAFYRKNIAMDSNPRNKQVVYDQMLNLLMGYFRSPKTKN